MNSLDFLKCYLSMLNTHLHCTHKLLAKFIENGATLIQFEFLWILAEVFCHRVTDCLQFINISLYFYQVGLRLLKERK